MVAVLGLDPVSLTRADIANYTSHFLLGCGVAALEAEGGLSVFVDHQKKVGRLS